MMLRLEFVVPVTDAKKLTSQLRRRLFHTSSPQHTCCSPQKTKNGLVQRLLSTFHGLFLHRADVYVAASSRLVKTDCFQLFVSTPPEMSLLSYFLWSCLYFCVNHVHIPYRRCEETCCSTQVVRMHVELESRIVACPCSCYCSSMRTVAMYTKR